MNENNIFLDSLETCRLEDVDFEKLIQLLNPKKDKQGVSRYSYDGLIDIVYSDREDYHEFIEKIGDVLETLGHYADVS